MGMIDHVTFTKTAYGTLLAAYPYRDAYRQGVIEWREWRGRGIPVLRGPTLPTLPLHGKQAWSYDRYRAVWDVMQRIPFCFTPYTMGPIKAWIPPSYDTRKMEATERMIERALVWVTEPKPYAPEETLFAALIRWTAYYQLAYGLLNERSMHVSIPNRARAQWITKGVWVRTWLYSLAWCGILEET